jgi:hypothetical protein
LRRERIGATARFWRFSAASYPDLIEALPKNPLTSVNRTVNGSFGQPSNAGVCNLLLTKLSRISFYFTMSCSVYNSILSFGGMIHITNLR